MITIISSATLTTILDGFYETESKVIYSSEIMTNYYRVSRTNTENMKAIVQGTMYGAFAVGLLRLVDLSAGREVIRAEPSVGIIYAESQIVISDHDVILRR